MVWGWFGSGFAETLAQQQEDQVAVDAEATKAAEEKAAKQPVAERRVEAKNNIEQAGVRMAARVVGMIEREASRLLDQFEILYREKSHSAVKKIMWETFKEEIDIASGVVKKEKDPGVVKKPKKKVTEK